MNENPSGNQASDRRGATYPGRIRSRIRRILESVWEFIEFENMKDWLPRVWGRRFLVKVSIASIILGMVSALMLHLLSRDLPTPAELDRIEQRHVTHVYDTNGRILKEFYTERREPVTLDKIPRHLKEALLAVEDREFYEHWGINLRRFAGAAWANLRNMDIVSGASTITQQLARNLFDKRIGAEQSVIRKLREQLTAVALERSFSKDEILQMYLNEMYFANGAYGIQQAARNYFDKDVEELDTLESAYLIGILQAPYRYFTRPDLAIRRRNRSLQYMVDAGYLAQSVADTLVLRPLEFAESMTEEPKAPFFVEWIRREMEERYGSEILYRDGASMATTLDLEFQGIAEQHLTRMLVEKQAGYDEWIIQPALQEILDNTPEGTEPDTSSIEDLRRRFTLQGAFVAMDPQNGDVLALIGGRDFTENEFNNAIQAERQAGSAFKPFLYTAALDNGYSPATRVMNQPIIIPQPDGSRWTPTNYYEEWGEPLPIREALRKSINLVAARVVTGGGMGRRGHMQPQYVVDYARQFGLTTPLRAFPSIAVGAGSVTLLEMVSAFSTFANLGTRVEPRMLRYVRDRFGREVEAQSIKRIPVIEPSLAYMMVDLMKGVLEPGGTAQLARIVYTLDMPAAGKTGTTNDFTDAWFIGYTPHLVAGVWIGFLDHQSMLIPGGRPVTGIPDPSGAVMAMPVWARFMRDVYREREMPPDDWTMPPGIVEVELCRTSFSAESPDYRLALPTCPDKFTEIFLDRYQPTEHCEVHNPSLRRDRRRPPPDIPPDDQGTAP
jgi:penicillin-binding protein 1A